MIMNHYFPNCGLHYAALFLRTCKVGDEKGFHEVTQANRAEIDDLTRSSSFGRVASQQLVPQLTAAGYAVKEMLLRDSVYISASHGEFLLSREISEISTEHDAQAVLVGTYAVGENNVFVTARLIRTADSVILASHDYAIPYTRDMRILLRDWE